jgi:hypothetical protein
MAQVIETYCDQHLENGEQVRGQTWRVEVKVPGSRAVAYEVDLCVDCAKPIVALQEALADQGRRPSAKRGPVPAEAFEAQQRGENQCPVCDKVLANHKSLQSHVRQQHEQTLAQALGEETPYVCSCGREFTTPQGLGVHAARIHGAA